ncbi:glycolytic genes transcriptional activator Gcr2p [Monosporozyma unispora]
MNEIEFNLLGNQADPPSTVDTASLSAQSTPFRLLHHQSTVDIFIIRAYNLLSNGAIINSNQLQSTTESPQTTMHTPSAIITNPNVAMKALTGEDGPLKPADFLNATEKSNNDDELNTNNNNANANNNANNTPDSISTFASNNTLIHNTYHFNIQLFQKISPLYTSILSNSEIDSIIDKTSSSPKSAIELFQRFIQIIKELELGFEVSPYAKYFHRLDEHLWQIKNDSEVEDDQLWQAVTNCIFAVYDAQSGKILSPSNNRLKKNGSTLATNVVNKIANNDTITPTDTNNNSGNNNSNTPSSSNSNPDAKSNSTTLSNGMSTDTTLTPAKKPKKKYTRRKPAAPKAAAKKATKANTSKAAIGKTTAKNVKRGGANSKITEEMLQQQQLLQDPTQGTFVNGLFGPDGSLPLQLQRKLQSISMNRDEHMNISRSLNGYYTQPTSPGPGLVDTVGNGATFDFNNLVPGGNHNVLNYHLSGTVLNNMNNNNGNNNNNSIATSYNANNIQNNNNDKNNNNNNVNAMNNNNTNNNNNNNNINNNWRNKNMDLGTLDENTVDELLQFSSNNNSNNNNNNDIAANNAVPQRRHRIDNITLETVSKQMKQTFDQVVQEKDQRIIQLERELQAERQETQWLRKMLIEDMGCVRSMLQDIKKD